MIAITDILGVTVSVPWPLLAYVLMGAATFIVYAIDKSRSRQNQWRIRESHLHALELLCGWGGALAAQQMLRHKNRKTPFQVVFWLIGLSHAAFWIWWFWIRG